MQLTNETIDSIYQPVIDNCYSEIKEKAESLGLDLLLRREKHYTGNTTMFFIELVEPLLVNEDDYGITIDIQVQPEANFFRCQIDVLKTTGPIYFSEKITIENDLPINENASFKKSKAIIESLPDYVLEIYRKDYTRSFKT